MNILVVEDNKAVSLIISRIAEELGHDYVLAADGLTAVRLFSQRSIDLAVVDVELPQLDGVSVGQQLRAVQPSLPILFISGNKDDDCIKRCQQVSNSLFLGKPLRPSQLRDALLHLSHSPAHQAALLLT